MSVALWKEQAGFVLWLRLDLTVFASSVLGVGMVGSGVQ